MKHLLFFLCSILIVAPLIGYNQIIDTSIGKLKIPFIYIEGDAGFSNGISLGINGNIILFKGWGLNVGYTHYYKNSKEFPMDYNAGLCLDLRPDGCQPMNHIFAYNFRITKRIITKTQLIRFKAEMGLVMIQYQKVHFYSVGYNGGLLGSNYYEIYSAIYDKGASIRFVSEYPFSKIAGLQVALSSTLSETKSFIGIEIGMSIGHLREKLRY
jgi:hypothetical protein